MIRRLLPASLVVRRIPAYEVFRKRFGNPYAVIHRADIHTSLPDGAAGRSVGRAPLAP